MKYPKLMLGLGVEAHADNHMLIKPLSLLGLHIMSESCVAKRILEVLSRAQHKPTYAKCFTVVTPLCEGIPFKSISPSLQFLFDASELLPIRTITSESL